MHPLIRPGCAHRALIDEELTRGGIRPRTIEFASMEPVKRCAAAGLGIALLPAGAIQREVQNRDFATDSPRVVGVGHGASDIEQPGAFVRSGLDIGRVRSQPSGTTARKPAVGGNRHALRGDRTSTVHRGPVASANRRSAVTSGASSSSGRAT
ncbi:hypothetical protein BN12_280007 [Nostocoides japonicum T1-X7]|uniref:LysR substrate-binding domain-containing protein n=1 Tax=Nostocoides japonicum T1-X7 TaxID=1194083 RepID=A0A077LXD9_9MICO|nr:LysR family transcriptional regulator substrate-binding protein [Tetrasphaera japonica]CCH78351.1 hypothetical protein BN12_280007 [Tetrasphaera japonica T1-X7]